MRLHKLLLVVLATTLVPAATQARTKLVTLPERAKMVVSLENPDLSLLYEEREIPLQKGTNFVDFAWNGVNIDPESVMLELLSHPGDGAEATKVIATGFPPNEQALTWQVYAPEPRTERIRVSYILYGVNHETSYDLRVNEKETEGDFRQYLRVRNSSGEDLDNAVLRLPQMDDLTRSMDSGETRRFLAQRQKSLPIEKLYVTNPVYYTFKGDNGEEVNLVYQVDNTKDAGLGKAKLPYGKARIYGDDGMGSSIFLGEDMLDATPPGEEAKLTLGKVKDVVLKRHLMKDEKENIRRNNSKDIILYDQVRHLRFEIENFKNEPVTLRINEQMQGDWEIREITEDGVTTERKSIGELLLTVELPASPKGEEAEKKIVDMVVVIKDRFPNER